MTQLNIIPIHRSAYQYFGTNLLSSLRVSAEIEVFADKSSSSSSSLNLEKGEKIVYKVVNCNSNSNCNEDFITSLEKIFGAVP